MADTEHLTDVTSEEVSRMSDLLDDERHFELRELFESALGRRVAALLRLRRAEADLLGIARHLGVRDTPNGTPVERVGS